MLLVAFPSRTPPVSWPPPWLPPPPLHLWEIFFTASWREAGLGYLKASSEPDNYFGFFDPCRHSLTCRFHSKVLSNPFDNFAFEKKRWKRFTYPLILFRYEERSLSFPLSRTCGTGLLCSDLMSSRFYFFRNCTDSFLKEQANRFDQGRRVSHLADPGSNLFSPLFPANLVLSLPPRLHCAATFELCYRRPLFPFVPCLRVRLPVSPFKR